MEKTINNILAYIQHTTDPELVLFFGSVATGTHNVHSDIDLLIITGNLCNRRRIAGDIEAYIREKGLPADILLYTKEELETALKNPYSFLASVWKTGKIIYKKKP